MVLVISLVCVVLVSAAFVGMLYLSAMQHKHDASNRKEAPPPPPRPDTIAVFSQAPGQGPPGSYGGTALYDACEILPLEALPKLGLPITPELTVTHTYFDGDVPRSEIVKQDALALPSSCDYSVGSGAAVTLHIYQPPFMDADKMRINRPDPEDAPISKDRGLDVSVRRNERIEMWIATVSAPGVIAEALVADPRGDSTGWNGKAIAEALRGPLVSRVLAGPTAHRQPNYTGGYEGAKNPCDALTPSAFEATLGKPAMPQANAMFRVGDMVMHEFDRSVSYRIDTACTRNALVSGGRLAPDHAAADVQISYWLDERGANTRQQSECRDTISDVEPILVDVRVGDGPVCMKNLGRKFTMFFKVGRATVHLGASSAIDDPHQEARRLAPMAQQIAANLRT